MPEREADTVIQALLDAFDLPERLPGVRAFVVAVLEDEPTGGRAANVIDLLVERRQAG